MSSYMGHSCKKIKNSVRKFCDFLSGKGVRGICPLQADFSKFPLREFGKIEACVPTQAVLAILHGKGFSLFRHCGKNYKFFQAMPP